MKEIEKGEFFPLNTEQRRQAFKFLAKRLRTGSKDKGMLVQDLYEEDIYSQKQDCKDFVKNCILSSNHEIISDSQRKVGLTGRKVVTS